MKKHQPTMPEEMIHIRIHPTELPIIEQEIATKCSKKIAKRVIKEMLSNRCMEFYPNGLKKGKRFNKAKECLRLIRNYEREIKKNKGNESNIEALIIDQLLELLSKMMLHELRQLPLRKLLG